MGKTKKPTRGTATCAGCMFGRPVTLTDTNKKGEVIATREMCECHVSRPTISRGNWPTVRKDDFCAFHVDAETAERTFAGLVPYGLNNLG